MLSISLGRIIDSQYRVDQILGMRRTNSLYKATCHLLFILSCSLGIIGGCSWQDLVVPDEDHINSLLSSDGGYHDTHSIPISTDKKDSGAGTADSEENDPKDTAELDTAETGSDTDTETEEKPDTISDTILEDHDTDSEIGPTVGGMSSCDGHVVGGTDGEFKTIGDAVDAFVKSGISESTTVCIHPGFYQEQVTIPKIEGATSEHRFTIQGMGEKNSQVIISYKATDEEQDWVMKLNGADYTSIVNITIQAEGHNFGKALVLDNDASHNIIQNNVITNTSEAASPLAELLGPNKNNKFLSNRFSGGTVGLRVWSVSWGVNDTQIENNNFSEQTRTAIDLQRANRATVANNRVVGASSPDDYQGIKIVNCSSGFRVEGNRVIVDSGRGITIEYCQGTENNPNLVFNNCVRVRGNKNAVHNTALYTTNATYLSLYYNTAVLGTLASFQNAAFNLVADGLMSTSYVIRNNIFANLGIGPSVAFDSVDHPEDCDYNDLYTTGSHIGVYGLSHMQSDTLTDWRSVLLIDEHSVFVEPIFKSNMDCHIDTAVAGLNNAELFVEAVLTDIDGDTRDERIPDIGADEFE